ncbi:hypothetical protein QUA35_13435 [Microcoleus sp. N9_B2]|uniref:hypothetical protein n=1 Tax=unclassified Microcoleus TaxID=2642155 RepID=UPI002FD1F276
MNITSGMDAGMDNSELQKRHFAALKQKYQVGQYNSGVSDSFLYLILRKADLGIQVTNLDFQWLTENRLVGTVEIISLQQYQAEDKKRLEAEFLQLRTKYHIPKQLEIPISSPVYSILWKLDPGYSLTDSDLELLNNHGLVDTITLIQDIRNFSKLKINYKATKNLNQFPEEPLYSILKKLDAREQLSNSEAEWLLELDFGETLEIHWQQEDERKAEIEFSELKSKYQIDSHPDTSISSPLYSILSKFNSELELEPSECEWLKQQNLSELISIDRERKDRRFFAELKNKYKATQYQSSEPSSRLFLILRIFEISESKTSNPSEESKVLIDEKDIQWLSEEGLVETVDIAKQIHFRTLKTKYQIVGQLALDPFYEIMLKLEREERLDPKQVIQLIEEGRLARHGKIAIAYYRLEAIFCEKEHQRTGNRWKLPSASSNWRKADEPEKALKVTENVNWNKVQESDLKSALWVTRGAAFRDLNQLDEAENCATQARECHPDSHQPYTLMGAICYDRGEYADGDNWFELAAERGADDTDDEIERIVRMTKDKDKRREVAEYLLSKDSNRYKWANSYLK